MRQPIEFTCQSHDGMIKVPEQYTDWLGKPVTVILLTQDILQSIFPFGVQEVLLAAVVKWYELGLIYLARLPKFRG